MHELWVSRVESANRRIGVCCHMATLHLTTADHPATLSDWAVDLLRQSPDAVVVVPGLHPRRRLLHALETADSTALQQMGPRVLTMADLRQHLGETVGTEEVLSALQWEEMLRAAIHRAVEAEDPWTLTLLDTHGRLANGVLRRVSRAVAELLQADMEPGELTDLLTEKFPVAMAEGLHALARDVAMRLAVGRATTWISARHAVAGAIANAPLAAPATRWIFLGLDGAILADGELQMAMGLLEHPEVTDVNIGLWAPDDQTVWETELPGQAPLLHALLERTGGARVILQSEDGAAWARQLGVWEAPMATPALTRVEAPDLTIAVEWTMRRVKRRIIEGQPMERIGLIVPQASEATPTCLAWAERLGVPLVASMEAPLDRAPIVRVVNALLSCATGTWTREALRAMAGHPAMALNLPLAVIDRAGSALDGRANASAWRSRLRLALGGDADTSPPLATFDALVERLGEACPTTPATASEWVKRVGSLLRAFQLHRGGVTPEVAKAWSEAGPAIRLNGEALNALWRALLGWARAGELGGDADRPVTVDAFHEAWLRLVQRSVARLSAYPQRGVWLLDPTQLTGMVLDEVYVLDLVEGAWDVHRPTQALLSDSTLRRALKLETEADVIAREQLLFQQALASIRSAGWLISHSRDGRGRACAPAPLLQMLALRHGSIPLERPTAAAMLPRTAAEVLMPSDAHWWAVPSTPAPARVLPVVQGVGASEDAIYSPSSLESFSTCGHRVQLTQAFGGEAWSEDEQQAARRQFYALWRAAQRGGTPDSAWGEEHEAAIAPVWQSLHPNLEVAAQLTTGLRDAVRLAWETLRAQRERMGVGDGPLRTVVLDRGVLLGEPRTPLRLAHEQTSWLIRSEVASVEKIDDPRCVGPLAKLQGMLILRELTWKTEGGAVAQASAWLKGDDLGLPLQAALAEIRYDAKVWGWERLALLASPPEATGFWVRDLIPHGEGLAVKPLRKGLPDHPIEAAMAMAREVSAGRVRRMREGDYPITPGYHCGYCPVRRACTSSHGQQARSIKQVHVPLRQPAEAPRAAESSATPDAENATDAVS